MNGMLTPEISIRIYEAVMDMAGAKDFAAGEIA
jgi:hypothetical protein